MNTPQNASAYKSVAGAGPENAEGSAEETLRLIARLPVPDGLEVRVMGELKSGQGLKAGRGGRVLHWPSVLHPGGSWMRSAAAAAIVFVVAGGGWGIYKRVQPGPAAKVIVLPRAGTGGGFSNAGAMRTPQTLSLPLVAAPVAVKTRDAAVEDAKPVKKTPAKVVPLAKGQVKTSTAQQAK